MTLNDDVHHCSPSLRDSQFPITRSTTACYADHSSSIGKLSCVWHWSDRLLSVGPTFGCFPKPSKTVLVVGHSYKQEAIDLFADLGGGSYFLGWFFGDQSLAVEFV